LINKIIYLNFIGAFPFLKKKGAGFTLQSSLPQLAEGKVLRRIYPEHVEGIPNAAFMMKRAF